MNKLLKQYTIIIQDFDSKIYNKATDRYYYQHLRRITIFIDWS